MPLDPRDVRILRALQSDGRLTNQELAERVDLSTSPCWRRVKQLETEQVICGYRAVIDRRAVGLGVLAFVRVRIDTHTQSEEQRFERSVRALDEVIACYAIAGEADFLLQIVAADLDDYAQFATTTIRRLPGIKEMHTMFVLKDIKPHAVLPIRGGTEHPSRSVRKQE